MAYIYGIIEKKKNISELDYVGKTNGTIKARFTKHKHGNLKIDKHMQKIGVENFEVIKIKECYEHELNALEKTYIQMLQPPFNVQYLK